MQIKKDGDNKRIFLQRQNDNFTKILIISNISLTEFNFKNILKNFRILKEVFQYYPSNRV